MTESAMHFILLKIYNKNNFPPGFDFKTKAVYVQEHRHSSLKLSMAN